MRGRNSRLRRKGSAIKSGSALALAIGLDLGTSSRRHFAVRARRRISPFHLLRR
jgi:hypothetical protein